jgi:hypothetical protein
MPDNGVRRRQPTNVLAIGLTEVGLLHRQTSIERRLYIYIRTHLTSTNASLRDSTAQTSAPADNRVNSKQQTRCCMLSITGIHALSNTVPVSLCSSVDPIQHRRCARGQRIAIASDRKHKYFTLSHPWHKYSDVRAAHVFVPQPLVIFPTRRQQTEADV